MHRKFLVSYRFTRGCLDIYTDVGDFGTIGGEGYSAIDVARLLLLTVKYVHPQDSLEFASADLYGPAFRAAQWMNQQQMVGVAQ